MSVADDPLTEAPLPSPADDETPRKSLTIGAVCKQLSQEFPDISISKIRYLEDQKLLSPRRTPGGYRLYSSSDVSRLRTILRMQRDEFLPLRVIRQALDTGRAEAATSEPAPSPSAGEASGTSVVSESSVTAPGTSACTCRSGARRRPRGAASRSVCGSRTSR